MGRIDKFLKRLSPSEQDKALFCLKSIISGNLMDLDVKKLKGQKYFYRVRSGNIRIIFTKKKDDVRIIVIERRSSNTYKKL